MQSSVIFSFIFCVGFFALLSGCFLYPKTKKDTMESAVVWVAVAIVAAMCFHTFFAGIMGVLRIPINIVSIGLVDLIVGVLLWIPCIKKKKYQKYEWKTADSIFVILLILGIALFSLKRYTGDLTINYFSVDPAIHYQSAMYIVNTQKIYGMFHAALNNALLIETLSPLFSVSGYYHIFVLGDILNLGLSGLMFYGAIRKYCKDRFTRIVAIILPFLYLAGYQGNSTLFGFVYLGMGITIIAYIVTVTDIFLRETAKTWFMLALLCLGCYGIFQCYVMFMPVVFVAVLTSILVKQGACKKLFSKETVIWGLAIFLLPCILGLFYILSGVFTGGTTVNSAIAVEGGIYRELYSNFLPYIPFALYGLYSGIRKKEHCLQVYLFPMWLIFTVVLLVLGYMGKVSSYYYYKTYYVMWLLVLWLCFYGIAHITPKERVLVVICGAMQLALMGNYFLKIEERIYKEDALFNPEPKDAAYNHLLHFQWQVMSFPPYSQEKLKLYEYVYDELLATEQNETVICVSEPEDYWWYQAITNQSNNGSNYLGVNVEEGLSNLPEEINYICVLYESKGYTAEQEYFSSMEQVFATEAGFVAKIKR